MGTNHAPQSEATRPEGPRARILTRCQTVLLREFQKQRMTQIRGGLTIPNNGRQSRAMGRALVAPARSGRPRMLHGHHQ
eukprot:1114137-Lingulodinium_polyedra.AAC.1